MAHTGDSKNIRLARAHLDAFLPQNNSFYTPWGALCQNLFRHVEWRMHGYAHLTMK